MASSDTGAITETENDTTNVVENSELILFQVKECYVYKIPPRKTAASYRADEWDINKWAWEGSLRVVSRGEECFIKLEDSKTGELFAVAPVYQGQPLPVEAVIDSSRFFVLRIEDTSGAGERHAFIGVGFRERPQAYDFQAALHDHVTYLNRKKEADEMEQVYNSKPAADYSLKEGQMLHLDIKTPARGSRSFAKKTLSERQRCPVSPTTPGGLIFDAQPGEMIRTASGGDPSELVFEQATISSSTPSPPSATTAASIPVLPPPPPSAHISPDKVASPESAGTINQRAATAVKGLQSQAGKSQEDEDFGDFQAAD